MEQIPQNILQSNEKIIWQEYQENNYRAVSCIFFGILSLALWSLGFYVFYFSTNNEPWYVFIGLGIFPLAFFIYSIKNKSVRYIATNSRLISINNENYNSSKSYSYQSIYKIYLNASSFINNKSNLEIKSKQTDHNNQYAILDYFKNLNIDTDIYTKIVSAWFKQNHGKINAKFKSIAENYDLNFQPFTIHPHSRLKMSGQYNGLNISFNLDGYYKVNSMNMSVECPNPYHKHFTIAVEQEGDGLMKIFGKQDFKIGNTSLDEKYILQSNDESFLNFILNNDIQNIILHRARMSSKIIFGNEFKSNKRTRKVDNNPLDLLDEHLIPEYSDHSMYNANTTSFINYKNEMMYMHLELSPHIVDHTIRNFEMIMSIAKRIQEYAKMNQN